MGYKGQRKSMKRVAAPKQWYLGKLKGVYAVRPSPGPHKNRECIPLNVLLQQRLKYARSRQESIKIVRDKDGNIKVDGKVRRDPRFPLGQMDVVTIEKTNEHFRILYDIKGRFQPHRIDAKEAGFKLCKVTQKKIGKSKVPHIVTNDGRTIRFPHPDIQINDSVKFDFKTKTIAGVIKFAPGTTVMLIGGNNVVELVLLPPSTSIQVLSRSAMLRTLKVTFSQPDSVTCSLLVMVRPPKFPSLREKVSDLLLSKRETPKEVTSQVMM